MRKEVRCYVCSKNFELEDQVYIDEFNTIHHIACFEDILPIKDSGTYQEIISKYDFFHDLLPLN